MVYAGAVAGVVADGIFRGAVNVTEGEGLMAVQSAEEDRVLQ